LFGSAQERSALTDTRLNEALESIENQAYVLNTLRGSLEDTNSNMAASLDRTDAIDLKLKTLSERMGGLADLEGRFATRAALKAVEERLQQVADKPAAAPPKDLEERLGGLAVSCKNLGMTVGDVKSRGDRLEGMFKEISQQLESLEELPKQAEELKSLQSKVGLFSTVFY
jgi:DNA repair ATPase RecN